MAAYVTDLKIWWKSTKYHLPHTMLTAEKLFCDSQMESDPKKLGYRLTKSKGSHMML